MHPWVQEDVIDQFLNSDRNEDGTSRQYIFSVWQVPEADDADEDNDAAEAGATAEDGDATEPAAATTVMRSA